MSADEDTMGSKRRLVIGCLSAGALGAVTSNLLAQDMVLGPAVEIADTGNSTYDVPVTMLKAGVGDPYWFASGSTTTRKYQGPVGGAIFQGTPIFSQPSSTYFSNLPTTPSGSRWAAWLTNLYQSGNGLLAFVHLEDQAPASGGLNQEDFKIGLAFSIDGGTSFQYVGDILDEFDAGVKGHNIKGTPYVIVDVGGEPHFYAYFNDLVDGEDTTSVARAKVSTVLAAAAAGGVTAWTKYNGSWGSESGLGGRSRHLNVPYWVNSHSDMAYVPDINRIVWAAPTDEESPLHYADGAALLFSRDGINWSGRTTVYTPPANPSAPPMLVPAGGYPFLGSSTAIHPTGNVLGRNFMYFFGYNGNDRLYSMSVSLDSQTELLSENFNTMTVGAPAPGWSVFGTAGRVQVAAVPRAARMFVSDQVENDVDVTASHDRGLRLTDTLTTANVSTVRGFAQTVGPVSVQFELRVTDNGSYQAIRLKGDGKSKDALRLYVFNGRLYWIDANDVKHAVAPLLGNRWYQLKVVADASSSSYEIYFDGSKSPASMPIPFLTPVSHLDAVAFNTGDAGTGGLWIDDVEVYRK